METFDRYTKPGAASPKQYHQSNVGRPLSYNPYDTMPEGCTLPGNNAPPRGDVINMQNNPDDQGREER